MYLAFRVARTTGKEAAAVRAAGSTVGVCIAQLSNHAGFHTLAAVAGQESTGESVSTILIAAGAISDWAAGLYHSFLAPPNPSITCNRPLIPADKSPNPLKLTCRLISNPQT
jgi:hypothetical protein